MAVYCPNCKDDRPYQVIRRQETYPVHGEPITVDAQIAVCQGCGLEISVAPLDDATLRSAFEQYRIAHGLLTAAEIVHLRERYQLSQRGLANLLGWGIITIQRYENGGIQDLAHDQVLRSLSRPEEVWRYTTLPTCRLSTPQLERLRRVLSNARVPNWDRTKADIGSAMNLGDVEQGFRTLDIDRLEQVVLWFAHHASTELYKTKLAKLLWLADFLHFRRERVSLTGLSYARVPRGPMPNNFTLLLGIMESDGTIYLDAIDEEDPRKSVIEPQSLYDETFFSRSELITLNQIAKHFGSQRATDLSNQSHREAAWRDRENGEIIPYTDADSITMLSEIESC